MTDNDKELLMLAAKAIGCTLRQSAFDRKTLILIEAGNERRVWSPLEDDGDALRLLNSLRLTVYHCDLSVVIKHKQYSWEWMGEMINEEHGDRNAATRRAIVRAAAEIGRGMA